MRLTIRDVKIVHRKVIFLNYNILLFFSAYVARLYLLDGKGNIGFNCGIFHQNRTD